MLKAIILSMLLIAWFLHRKSLHKTAGALMVAAILGGGLTLMPATAECRWCPSYTCYGASTCGQCVCMSRDYSGGDCVDIQMKERLEARGWQELP